MAAEDADRADHHHYTLPDHLRIGQYVYLDLPWLRHPFTLNSFKISSEEQIHELRALRISRFRYDPARSDPDSAGSPPAPPAGSSRPAFPLNMGDGGDTDRAEATMDSRVRQLREYRKATARAEKSFLKALGIVRRLDKELLTRPADVLEEMGGLVAQMATVFLERPEVTLQLMGENCGGEEVYHHSLNVSILCMMLVRGLQLTREGAGKLGTGALLHDIGLREIPDRVARKSPREQIGPERELRARHVECGMNIGRQLSLVPDILSVIEQHHELADGSGYPRGLRLEQISPLARIVSLVNFYENLCNPVDFSDAVTPHEALSLMFARHRGKFDARILQLMIRALGVYPPGSVVKLSNDSIAMVVSVNPHKPLRPWVLPYDPALPKGSAVMLNLEMEQGLNISGGIRPSALPVHIYAYLSPRKRITYFFDGGALDTEGRA